MSAHGQNASDARSHYDDSCGSEAQSCDAVAEIALVHLTEIDRKVADLTALRGELDRIIGSRRHGTVADCKVIETLAPRGKDTA